MEFWLKQGTVQIQLPVPPPEFEMKSGNDHQKVNVYQTGDMLLWGNTTLDTITFQSFFPSKISNRTYQCPYSEPWTIIAMINKWRVSGKPVSVLITGTGINMECLIDAFEYGANKGLDINFSLTFTEYRRVAAPDIGLDTGTDETNRPTPPVVPPTEGRKHTVKSGESLWSISKKYYDTSSKWRTIWDANKPMRSGNANLIYPGEVVKIP